MVPHKTKRGALALNRLSSFVGVPPPYDKTKRLVVPSALRISHLRPGRKYTRLGDLAKSSGWKYSEVVDRLEAKRTVRAKAYYKSTLAAKKLRAQALKKAAPKIAAQAKVLEQFAYPLL